MYDVDIASANIEDWRLSKLLGNPGGDTKDMHDE